MHYTVWLAMCGSSFVSRVFCLQFWNCTCWRRKCWYSSDNLHKNYRRCAAAENGSVALDAPNSHEPSPISSSNKLNDNPDKAENSVATAEAAASQIVLQMVSSAHIDTTHNQNDLSPPVPLACIDKLYRWFAARFFFIWELAIQCGSVYYTGNLYLPQYSFVWARLIPLGSDLLHLYAPPAEAE